MTHCNRKLVIGQSPRFAFTRIALSAFTLLSAAAAIGQDLQWPDPIANDVVPFGTSGLSHGPLLGAVTDDSVRVWVRTRAPAQVSVVYSTSLPLSIDSPGVTSNTTAASDLTAVHTLQGLNANTRYFYAVIVDGMMADLRVDMRDAWPSFKTLPNRQSFVDPAHNPRGLFNVKFAIGHCASQERVKSGGQYGSPPAYDTIRTQHGDEIMFALVNGDIIYEEERDGTLDGVRRNYRTYLERGRSFSALFRKIPALFTFDDHDVGWDLHGCGQVGLGPGRHLMRDTGLLAYQEYASWANYRGGHSGTVRLGRGSVKAGGDVLFDPSADFTSLDPRQVSTIHLGSYTRTMQGKPAGFAKNAGVYQLARVLDGQRLQISPAAKAAEELKYSIGTHHFYDWRISNCHFFALDTRGERSARNPRDRADPSLFILGDTQKKWLIDGIASSDAQFIFIISPDPWMIYHTAAHVGGDDKDDKGDGFPSFLHERAELLNFMDDQPKPILIFTGDVHASASVMISDNVWEMMCGPLGSTGHPLATLGNPPTGGRWNSMGHDVEIRWVAGFPNNLPYHKIRNTYYGIVQVNNVLPVASPLRGYQFAAYDEPQVIVRWHDGYTGKLVYAESITTRDAKMRDRSK